MNPHLPTVSPARMATAPYNFVPLPNPPIVLRAPDLDGARHDRYDATRHTGWIDLRITARTPLYIRGTLTEEQARRGVEAKDLPAFFAPSGVPMIPGSSLRGAIRALVEILSWSKVEGVSDARLFFREFQKSDTSYLKAMRVEGTGEPRARPGYLFKRGQLTVFRPAQQVRGCAYVRVHEDIALRVLGPDLEPMSVQRPEGRRPNREYRWRQCEVWFRVTEDTPKRGYYLNIQDGHLRADKPHEDEPGAAEWQHGVLVASGWIPGRREDGRQRPGKQRHWLIADPLDDDSQDVTLGFDDERLYREGGGVTARIEQEERRGFKIFSWRMTRQQRIPCFLVQDEGGAVYFGHTPMFRYPYARSIHAAFPKDLRDPAVIDLTGALFGRANDQGWSAAGRVSFEDARYTGPHDRPAEPVASPKVLSTPKPTSYQHYLAQSDDQPGRLTDWDKDEVTARGHKVFWHRPGPNPADPGWRETTHVPPGDTQHTRIAPLKAGATFESRIRFENLTDVELGALLTALDLPEGCAHRLGMGKPLGLGSVHIQVQRLALDRRIDCYRSLFDVPSDVLSDEALDKRVATLKDAFATWVLQGLRASNDASATGTTADDLWMHWRLQELRVLLTYDSAPPQEKTATMLLDQFRQRKVLPRATQAVRDEAGGGGARRPTGRGGTAAPRTHPAIPGEPRRGPAGAVPGPPAAAPPTPPRTPERLEAAQLRQAPGRLPPQSGPPAEQLSPTVSQAAPRPSRVRAGPVGGQRMECELVRQHALTKRWEVRSLDGRYRGHLDAAPANWKRGRKVTLVVAGRDDDGPLRFARPADDL